MNGISRIAVGFVLLVGLAGCQSLAGANRLAGIEVRPLQPPQLSGPAQVTLGRTALGERNLFAAITAFRAATLDPGSAAEACNGLAVAYARLRRGDLAERYFRRAVQAAPHDPRFAANLARFYASPLAAVRKAPDADGGMLAALPDRRPLSGGSAGGVPTLAPRPPVPPGGNRLERISNFEVRVVTRQRPSPFVVGPALASSDRLPSVGSRSRSTDSTDPAGVVL